MYIGVDLGGTNIASGLVDKDGALIDTLSVATESIKGSEHVIAKIIASVKELMERNELSTAKVGIGVPGIVDAANGVVLECVNLGWKDIPVRQMIKDALNVEVYLDNDASVAALAEVAFGSMKGYKDAIMLTLGTGVGGGIVHHGKLVNSRHGVATELGHMVVGENFYDCACGRNGCVETFSSATGINQYAKKLITEKRFDTAFVREYQDKLHDLTAKAVFDAAKAGDLAALDVVNRSMKYLAKAIINLQMVLEPEIISIGGGVAYAGDFLLESLTKALEKERNFKGVPLPKIVIATLKNDAGIIGAAMLGQYQ